MGWPRIFGGGSAFEAESVSADNDLHAQSGQPGTPGQDGHDGAPGSPGLPGNPGPPGPGVDWMVRIGGGGWKVYFSSVPPTAALGVWGDWCFVCGVTGNIWYRGQSGWVKRV